MTPGAGFSARAAAAQMITFGPALRPLLILAATSATSNDLGDCQKLATQ
jgi:hypothetical protein